MPEWRIFYVLIIPTITKVASKSKCSGIKCNLLKNIQFKPEVEPVQLSISMQFVSISKFIGTARQCFILTAAAQCCILSELGFESVLTSDQFERFHLRPLDHFMILLHSKNKQMTFVLSNTFCGGINGLERLFYATSGPHSRSFS